ncbi:retinol dehydrogenase 12 [Folsomia candida]|uniref:Retinol dehydrogenase 12 n=1 Tax=Folsomia candida TaxID=158441 RepID=A0A226D5Z9_FOLCA|nr:retinol dehydrogenase 12 [Folsomia candida]OXA40975.1 Retinol dehydrogenase 12 [Folsomia candida]
MSSWTTKDIPNLTGKVAMAAGGTRGICLHTAIGLASAGAEVTILGSNFEHGENAIKFIKEKVPHAKLTYTQVDFASLKEIADFAKNFNKNHVGLDILVNNAGIYTHNPLRKTCDGFESTFAVNHLAPFALTAQLLPSLRKSASPRVVNVSSLSAYYARIWFDDIQFKKSTWYLPTQVYAQSKLANLSFTAELQKRSDFNGWGLTAVSVMPGLVRTTLLEIEVDRYHIFGRFFKLAVLPWISNSVEEGAQYSLFAATFQNVSPGALYGPPGSYFAYCGPIRKIWIPCEATDPEIGESLWLLSERMTQVKWPRG